MPRALDVRGRLQDQLATVSPEDCGWTRALYTQAQIPAHRDNPFIEALPAMMDRRAALSAMRRGSPTTSEMRALPTAPRMYIGMDLEHNFEPLGRHLELYQALDIVLKQSYVRRSPLSPDYYRVDEASKEALRQSRSPSAAARAQVTGLSVIGEAGVGKSLSVQMGVECFPAVIYHELYHGRPLRLLQIPRLYVEMPKDGKTRSLLPAIFHAIDTLLVVTEYYSDYCSGRPTEESMLDGFFRVARLHGIGLLVIDEIQNLNQSHGNGADETLNFLSALTNVIRVSVVLVGDETSVSLLGSKRRQARRATGIGLPQFKPLPQGAEFTLLCTVYWSRLVLRAVRPLTELDVMVLHDLSQGNPDMVMKLIRSAQQTALSLGLEEMSHDLLRDAYHRKLWLLTSHVDFARGGTPLDPQLIAEAMQAAGVEAGQEMVEAEPLLPANPRPSPRKQAASRVPKTKAAGVDYRRTPGKPETTGSAAALPPPDPVTFWQIAQEV